MISRVVLYVCILFFQHNVWAYPSLLLTKEEIRAIETNLNARENVTLEKKGELTLSAIVYLDDKHWTIWVNDQIIRPDSPPHVGEFRIEKVTSKRVKFSCPSRKASLRETFVLYPHQTYKHKQS